MPKASRKKYYAVKVGKEGPRIYETWDECKENVSRFPGAVHKSFLSRRDAEEWLFKEVNAVLVTSPPAVSLDFAQATVPVAAPMSNIIHDGPAQATPIYDTTSFAGAAPMGASDPAQMTAPAAPPIVLSSEQQDILNRVRDGQNVFFTGSAGTGKSVLLREIIKLFQPSNGRLAITASTGIASVNIGGTTLHSWAGIGLGQEPAKQLAGKIIGQNGPSARRWRRVNTLIIDEISMIDGVLFDKLEHVACRVRGSNLPFGGIQLVVSGDFCQLPPVPDQRSGKSIPATFAFDSQAWGRCIGSPVTLTRVFRQKEQEFVDMLNKMRFGRLDSATTKKFKHLSRPVTYDDGIGPTELYPTRREVENANNTRLDQINDKSRVYNSMDRPGRDSTGNTISFEQMTRLLDRLVAMKQITLKTGAQVMLIKNLVQGELVNGSTGKIIGFSTFAEASQEHRDLALGEPGQEAKEVPDQIKRSRTAWPLVRFTNGREMLCIPTDFTVNNSEGETEASRIQVPLILAWALSVHKSQGQTLERVKVNLHRTFEKGQAYVALSRATTMDKLEVLNFDPTKVMAHPRVLEWHKELDRNEEDKLLDEYDEYNEYDMMGADG